MVRGGEHEAVRLSCELPRAHLPRAARSGLRRAFVWLLRKLAVRAAIDSEIRAFAAKGLGEPNPESGAHELTTVHTHEVACPIEQCVNGGKRFVQFWW